MSNEPQQTFRPFLTAALFCEKVLREHDNVLSIVRVVDRFTIQGHSEDMPETSIPVTIVLLFKSGFLRGKATIKVKPTTPSGKELPAMEFLSNFEGDNDRGVGIIGQISFSVKDEGVYWFEVSVLGDSVTSIPLRVLYQRTTFGAGLQ